MMKKIVIGMLLGAVLMFSGQAVADSISKIGRKVQGEVVVKVDGVTLDVKGLVVDGQTNVPARAFADASGFDIAFENKEVLLTKKGDEKVSEPTKEPVVTPEPQQSEGSQSELSLEQINENINRLIGEIDKYEKLYSDPRGSGWSTDEQKEIDKFLSNKRQELERLKNLKAELEAKK